MRRRGRLLRASAGLLFAEGMRGDAENCLVAMSMSGVQISEEQIAAMSHQERRDLMMRLARASSTIVPVPQARRIRRSRLALNFTAVFFLLPWIVYLGLRLPDHYVARNWATAWVGFDVFLLVMFALTAILGLLRRELLVLAAFGTGVLIRVSAMRQWLLEPGQHVWIVPLSINDLFAKPPLPPARPGAT